MQYTAMEIGKGLLKPLFAIAVLVLGVAAFAGEELVWDGKSSGSKLLVSANSVAVKSGSPVRFDITWKKHEWNFGSFADIRIRWEDADGKQLVVSSIDTVETAIPGAINYQPRDRQ